MSAQPSQRAGAREPSRGEHLAALRNGADHLVRLVADLGVDGDRQKLLAIAAHLSGLQRAANLAAHMRAEIGPESQGAA